MASILLVDSDVDYRSALAAALEENGYVVVEADNGRDAMSQITFMDCDLVITETRMPVMDGYSFIRALRRDSMQALVPVFIVSKSESRQDKIMGFRLGIDEYISKRTPVSEIIGQIGRSLSKTSEIRREATDSFRRQSGFLGDLAMIGPASVLSMCQVEKKSGELVFNNIDEEARLLLYNGTLIGGELRSRDGLSPEDVVYELMSWNEGSFAFTARNVEPAQGVPLQNVLMEVARRIDEATGSGELPAAPDARPSASSPPSSRTEDDDGIVPFS